ncbi:unnamed protein product [Zymoseptoria tritici ST99CH_3D7]|uniref:BTB domain-containing protein n=1 Tax=Zymoseptoria tritici (strain ST99CH_3D7) TaxID=1276538 RepID=A0A1X7S928_ZYMT9|nr:unnamed protein product [Zymoseptoria tritici ST99CH_3D7]
MVLPDKANASKALPSKARQHASSKIPNIPFVRVNVGDPNGPPDQYHTFRLPGKLLASKSDYFKKAIEWQMREGKPLACSLPEVSPATFTTFLAYLHFGGLP